jgi:hypothetical protein
MTMNEKQLRAAIKAERRAEEAKSALRTLITMTVLGVGGWWWLTSGHTTASNHRPKEAAMPSAQLTFVSDLEVYRNQYREAQSNKNDIQQNRIFDARKEALCAVDAQVQNWTGKVYRVDTSVVDSRNRASLNLQISDNVWINGNTVDSKDNPELFEAIAKLQKGDRVKISGRLDLKDNCVRETSITQYGGMTTPEFRISYSEINGTVGKLVVPKEEKPAAPPPTPKPGEEVSQAFFEHISGEMAYDCQQAIKRFIKYDIRAPGLMWGHNSGSDAMFLLRMSRWSQKVAADNTITIAGDEGEAQNGMGNWVRINYTCTVNLNNKTVKRAAFNQGRLQ